LLLGLMLGVAGCGTTQGAQKLIRSHRQVRSVAASPHVIPDSFVSLVPACACVKGTELDVFSLRDGRRLRSIGRLLPRTLSRQLGDLAATNRGQLFYPVTSGPVCARNGYMECPKWIPDSCVNRVERFESGVNSVAFTMPGAETLGSAVPNAQGSAFALTVKPCSKERGLTGLLVRADGGRTHRLLTTNNRCDAYGAPSWNAAGTALVITFDQASGPPIQTAGGDGCPFGPNRLAIVRLRRSRAVAVQLTRPRRGCEVEAAGFDRSGIAAAEGCWNGSPPRSPEMDLGHAYLVQMNQSGKPLRRVPLQLGLVQAVVAPIPHTGALLVTQDQPGGQSYPERDWVWEFNGTRLRAVGHYRADGEPQVLAVPW
jgi:hypothetical protein